MREMRKGHTYNSHSRTGEGVTTQSNWVFMAGEHVMDLREKKYVNIRNWLELLT
jgi:hypothetical protein